MPEPTKGVARLITAFEWQCDECGTRNFVSAISMENPPPGADGHDDEDEPGEWLVAPNRVRCSACATWWSTVDAAAEDLEEDGHG